jgi:hypothetical protein
MSPQARREREYRHYVQKCMHQRQRQVARAQKAANRQMKKQMKLAHVSDPQMTTSLGPEPGTWSEPITVSGPNGGAIQQPVQPSQPSQQ